MLHNFILAVATLQEMWRNPLRSWDSSTPSPAPPPTTAELPAPTTRKHTVPPPAKDLAETARDNPDVFFAHRRSELEALLPEFSFPLTYEELVAGVAGTRWKETQILAHLDSIVFRKALQVEPLNVELHFALQRAHAADLAKGTVSFSRTSARARKWTWNNKNHTC